MIAFCKYFIRGVFLPRCLVWPCEVLKGITGGGDDLSEPGRFVKH